ncbi:hypothetical protein MCAP1_002825 [Malassezia caprae]|uniref:Uncharacterized protein n=1 Tax=Malassezia caprae TaxID=1381934 RepID=A0AAF0E7M8_9BASI|nr:hypothetical protein MCAP1_002825 [Malassezia caprae]
MTEPSDEKPPAVQGLSASEVLHLLEDYKAAPSSATLDRLAVEYDVDRTLIGKLVQFVRAPEEQPLP